MPRAMFVGATCHGAAVGEDKTGRAISCRVSSKCDSPVMVTLSPVSKARVAQRPSEVLATDAVTEF